MSGGYFSGIDTTATRLAPCTWTRSEHTIEVTGITGVAGDTDYCNVLAELLTPLEWRPCFVSAGHATVVGTTITGVHSK